MKNHFLTLIAFAIFTTTSFAQVGINSDSSSPNPSAMLDVKSFDKGLLIPRLTTIERNAIASPAIGLMVFDTNLQEIFIFNSDGWKQGTMSKIPLELSGNSNNIIKITSNYPANTNMDNMGALTINHNGLYGKGLVANTKSGVAITGIATESGGAGFEGIATNGNAAFFKSESGNAVYGYSNNGSGISMFNNSDSNPTARFINYKQDGVSIATSGSVDIVSNNLVGLKVKNTYVDSGSPVLTSAAEFISTSLLGSAISARSVGNIPTIDARNTNGAAIFAGTSGTGIAGGFFSTSGVAVLANAGTNHAISGSNGSPSFSTAKFSNNNYGPALELGGTLNGVGNSNTIPTAKFTNNGGGPAMELNSDLNIIVNKPTGLKITNNDPANTYIENIGALTINHNGLYGNGLVATTKYGVAITGIGTESGGSGFRGFATTGDAAYFFSNSGRAVSGSSLYGSAMQMSNSSNTNPTSKFFNFSLGGVALELTGNLQINGKIINEAYQTPTFENNWTNFGSEWNTAKFYKGKDGRVYLEGVVTGGSGSVICTLPVGYRPASRVFFIVSHDGNGRGRIDIQANGVVSFDYGANRTMVGLDGISFRVE